MQHLTPVGLSEDGESLVLVSDAGEEYVVRVDQRFRTALRGDQARLGQVEMKMESALRPRDIQARIRAGESAEDVAAAAQSTVEAIMPYAGPVLAERAHVAQTALKGSIRRRSTETGPVARTLDEAARQHLSTVGVRADDVTWDAWRRDDGRWTLLGSYVLRGTEHRATFTYDQPGRYVVAEDEAARLLTGEASAAPAADPVGPERRLSSVPAEDELPLGDDAIELVRGPQPPDRAPELPDEPPSEVASVPSSVSEGTTDLTATAEAVRSAADPGPSFDDLAADHADADWIAELPLEDLGTEPAAQPVPAQDDQDAQDALDALDAEDAEREPADEPSDNPGAAPAPTEQKARKKGRSSVPSWDEIMFGGGGARE